MRSTHFANKRSFGKGLSWPTVVAVLAFVFVNTAPRAQSPQTSGAPSLSFEVASIKPDHSGSGMARMGGPSVNAFTATNVTAKMLISFAYNVREFQVSGGPGWISSNKFDVDAKVEDSLAEQLQKLPRARQLDQMRSMVQTLLADRFKLTVTHDTKELPVYALVVARGGPKLKEVATPDVQGNSTPPPASGGTGNLPSPPPGSVLMRMGMGRAGEATLTAKGAALADLVNLLSQQLGRPILDQTGLKGIYDFTLQWTADMSSGGGPMQAAPGPDAPPADSSGTSIFTALQEQLGLRLESTKGPAETILINRVEEPSEN